MSTLAVLATVRRSWDADAGAYIKAVEVADGQQLEPAVAQAINQFVLGCKADGTWSSIKASCILCGARTLSGALIPLAGTAPTNNNFVSGDYNRKTGLVGNKTNKWLTSNRLTTDDALNSQHLSVFASTAATSATNEFPVYIGALGGDAGASHFGRLDNNGVFFSRSRTVSATSAAAGSGSATGFIAISRGNSSQYSRRLSGVNALITVSSQTPASKPLLVFASSGVTTDIAPATQANCRLSFYSIGADVDLALLDARVTTLYNAIGAAIP